MALATASRRTANPETEAAATRYFQAAYEAGCPKDQIENFISRGVVLQERQLCASALARECDREGGPTELGYGGARGGGKSHWLIAQMAADDCQRHPGLKCLLLRKVGKANRENFEDLRRRLLGSIPHVYKQQEGVLVFPNESRIICGHFQHEKDVDAYLGLEYDVIGVEEATTLTQTKYKDIRTCNRSSKDGWRPRMYSTTNPGGVGHAWYKALFIDPFRKNAETRTRFVPATADDNRCLNKEYVASVLDTLTGWKLKAWRRGDWDIAAGQFFTNWDHSLHVIKNRELPKHWRKWCALDYGFTHYTVVYLLAQDDDGNVYLVDEHAERRWLPARHAPAIHAMLERHGLTVTDLQCFVAGHDVFQKGNDEAGKTTAETYAEHGIKLSHANINRVNGASEILTRLGDAGDPDTDPPTPPIPPTLFIFERCARLIECIPALEHDEHRPEDVLKVDCDEEGDGGDDPYDAARYGVMAASAGPREISFWTF